MFRSLQAVVPSTATLEGDGFLVHRPFPTRALSEIDPFLLLDEMGPIAVAPGEAKGASDHPHRGFEIITYLMAGAMEHADSHGHRGSLGVGDAQYMLAGDGVVHAEQPSAQLQRDGGTVHGIQLWINLPARDKRLPPTYRDLRAAAVPVVTLPDGAGTVRVLARRGFGVVSPLQTQHPIDYFRVLLAPGASLEIAVSPTATAVAYPVAGTLGVGSRAIARGELAIFRVGEERVRIVNPGATELDTFVLASEPIGEPIARYGPFVMSTREEIEETIAAYRSGRFGEIPAVVRAI